MSHFQCPICLRTLGTKNTSKHHLNPKAEGGRYSDTVWVHNICHQKIHSLFTEKELSKYYSSIEQLAALRAHPEMAKFIVWVRTKDSAFYQRNKWTKARRDAKIKRLK